MNSKNKFVLFTFILLDIILVWFVFYIPYKEYNLSLNFSFLSRHLEEINVERQIQQEAAKESPKPEDEKIPILVYHSIKSIGLLEPKFKSQFSVPPGIFEKELQYLQDNKYSVISFGALVDHLLENTPLPSKPVVITFDDGWETQYAYAFPLLIKYKDTATFFVYTNAIGQKNFMTWQQIKNLDTAGMTIGSHTKSHPYLAKILNKQKLTEEIAGSKKIIEEKLGEKVDFFAYPFGHYNDQVIAVVKEAGYKAARSFYRGAYNTKEDLFTLKVISANNNFDKFVENLAKP